MKPYKKMISKFDRRSKGYESACVSAEKKMVGSSKGYTRPGSRNPKKQG